MQSIRNTHIDPKGGLFQDRGPYPLFFNYKASSGPDEESQVTISCFDFIFTLPQHSALCCKVGKNSMICKA